MALSDLIKSLEVKPVVRGGVLLSVDEYQEVMALLKKRRAGRPRKTEVPREATR